jgi:thiol-disulfide isomerase/thioredoxin
MRKRLIIIGLILGLVSGVQAKGIQFLNDTVFENVLKLAQQQQKMIFIDCYAVWCGPCKYMDREIFPDEAVGEFHNSNFINIKYDMEKPYGIRIKEKYQVKGYPTFLYLDPNGELVHRGIGSTRDAASFIEIGKAALSGDKSFKAISEKVRKGDRTASTLLEYLNLNFRAPETVQLITEHFSLVTDEEKFSKESWGLVNDHLNDVESVPFQFFLKHRDRFATLYGAKTVEDKLYNTFSIIYRADPEAYQKLKGIDEALFERNRIEMAYRGANSSFIRDKSNPKLWNEMIAGAEKYIAEGNPTANQLNSIAWNVYENHEAFKDKNALKKAEVWAKKALSMEPGNAAINDTYAHILFALGNKKGAVAQQQKAVSLAKAAGSQGVAQMEANLLKFRGKK